MSKFKLEANKTVFFSSASFILLLVAVTLIVGEPMEDFFVSIQSTISSSTGWFFILVVNILLFFAIYLGTSKFGDIRIGGKDARPEFSNAGWFSMLFSAGMGIGLLFWSVAEPITHFQSNPFLGKNATDIKAAETAMGFTFLHWGLHAWAVYAIVALALAYFCFNKGLPLTIRSIFYPIFKEKIHGITGDLIDIISVLATLFGLATSLGFGVQQVNAGLDFLFGIPYDKTIQVILIAIITGGATLSLVLGLDKGIRILSEMNMRIALFLLVAVLILGPTLFLLRSFVQNLGFYIFEFFNLSFWSETYQNLKGDTHWQNDWTVFYWAWWISWSPFVGIFIARISRGRTVREFLTGILIVPTLLTFLWISVFGGSALQQVLSGNEQIVSAVQDNVATAIYQLFEQFPFTFFLSLVAVILVTSFFVTSSDSGSYVVDTLTSGGKLEAPVSQKIFWAGMEGLVAAVLLIGGGLKALQAAAILTGLPFALIILMICFSLHKSFSEEYIHYQTKPSPQNKEKKETEKATN